MKLGKYSNLIFRIFLVSGIVLHSLLSIRFFESRSFFDMFSLMFLVYAFSWIIGDEISKRNYGIKHFGIVISILLLGVSFLLLTFLGVASYNLGLSNYLVDFILTPFGDNFLLFCLFGGMVFLTVGVCGFESRSSMNNKRYLLVVFNVVVIPSLAFLLFMLVLFWFSPLTVGL